MSQMGRSVTFSCLSDRRWCNIIDTSFSKVRPRYWLCSLGWCALNCHCPDSLKMSFRQATDRHTKRKSVFVLQWYQSSPEAAVPSVMYIFLDVSDFFVISNLCPIVPFCWLCMQSQQFQILLQFLSKHLQIYMMNINCPNQPVSLT